MVSTLCKDCHINLQYNNALVAALNKYCLKADDNVIWIPSTEEKVVRFRKKIGVETYEYKEKIVTVYFDIRFIVYMRVSLNKFLKIAQSNSQLQ